MKNITDYKESLSQPAPPKTLSVYLQALWLEGKGDWDAAHTLIQDVHDKTAYWIHAYLHRKEGDEWNAGYWYARAGKKKPSVELEAEWEDMVKTLL